MTNKTEQQAVPVAQIDVDLANKIGAAFDYNAGPEETWLEEMLARHRLDAIQTREAELAIPADIPQYEGSDISHLESLASYLDNYAKEKGRERLPASRDLFNEMAKRFRQFDALLAVLNARGGA